MSVLKSNLNRCAHRLSARVNLGVRLHTVEKIPAIGKGIALQVWALPAAPAVGPARRAKENVDLNIRSGATVKLLQAQIVQQPRKSFQRRRLLCDHGLADHCLFSLRESLPAEVSFCQASPFRGRSVDFGGTFLGLSEAVRLGPLLAFEVGVDSGKVWSGRSKRRRIWKLCIEGLDHRRREQIHRAAAVLVEQLISPSDLR